jgi:hypothetical protein
VFTALASRNGANGPFSLVKLAIEHNGHYALTDWHGGLQLWKTVLYSVYHTFSMATVVME